MGFRNVKINSRCKLETFMGYMVCRGETETRILLDEINLLIIENQQVCITAALMAALIEHKVRIEPLRMELEGNRVDFSCL